MATLINTVVHRLARDAIIVGSVSILAEAAGEYELAGHMMAYIVEHGGPAPQFLSETAFSCLLGRPDVDVTDVVDITLRNSLMQV